MDPLKLCTYLTLARGRVFDCVRPLTPEQYTRRFEIGPGSLACTLTHIMICEWMYVRRMQGLAVPPYAAWPIKDETPPPFATLEAEWTRQAAATRSAVAALWHEGEREPGAGNSPRWSTPLKYTPLLDPGEEPFELTASPADIFSQLVLHEVHHRAQAVNMLRHLGVTVGDIDFNELMYGRNAAR